MNTSSRNKTYGNTGPHYQPKPAEIADACREFQADWSEGERELRLSQSSDAQVELMASILKPMSLFRTLVSATDDETNARLDVERDKFIGDAIEPLVKLIFSRSKLSYEEISE